MKRTEEIKRELDERQFVDYLQQYYHELTDNTVPEEVKKQILNKCLGI